MSRQRAVTPHRRQANDTFTRRNGHPRRPGPPPVMVASRRGRARDTRRLWPLLRLLAARPDERVWMACEGPGRLTARPVGGPGGTDREAFFCFVIRRIATIRLPDDLADNRGVLEIIDHPDIPTTCAVLKDGDIYFMPSLPRVSRIIGALTPDGIHA